MPTVFQSTVSRCIDCVSTWDSDQHSLTIEIHSNKTAYFYLDAPETISRLEELAESEFERALRISDELKATVFHSPVSREHVREIHDMVNSMQANLTERHYEFVFHKLDRVVQSRALAVQEENNYTRTEAFVNSVRQDILSSQGYLSKWQLVLLSQAYESLNQGNYTSAIEWAKQANDLPREPAPEESDPTLTGVLWNCSLALLGVVAVFIALLAFRRRKPSTEKMRPSFLMNPERLDEWECVRFGSCNIAQLMMRRSSPILGMFAPHVCPKICSDRQKGMAGPVSCRLWFGTVVPAEFRPE